jgi:DNA-binding transcriptional ArsR family regulator
MKEAFPSDFCGQRLKVLADPIRLAVMHILLSEGPKHVGELNAVIEVEQRLLSHHLKILREKGFVMVRRDGKAVLYEIAPSVKVSGRNHALNLGCCTLDLEATKASKCRRYP